MEISSSNPTHGNISGKNYNSNLKLYAGQEEIVRIGLRITDWFQIGKGVRQGCILSTCLFNLYAEYIMQKMLGWMKHMLESKFPGKISITSDTQMIPPLWHKVMRN